MDKRRDKVHPVLLRKIDKVLEAMFALGFPMMITDGARTAEQQNTLYQVGRTRPGRIITKADGYRSISNHQIKSDGFGHAVDCTFLGENGKPRWTETDPWQLYAAMLRAVGLKWGADNLGTPWDKPHAELPKLI
jgi:hypothetical protein